MTFGQSQLNFLADSPAAVAQCVGTRLNLWEGDWFLDLLAGTPWMQEILQQTNYGLAEELIRNRILETPYVLAVNDLSVSFDNATRAFSLSGTVLTAFSTIALDLSQMGSPPFALGSSPLGGSDALG